MQTIAIGSPTTELTADEIGALLRGLLDQVGPLRRVLLVPPDFTRRHSGAGEVTVALFQELTSRGGNVAVLPALGTHTPMTAAELAEMFPGLPRAAFHVHNWRTDLHRLGAVPAEFVRQVSGGLVAYPIYCDVNRLLLQDWDRIFCIGQLVPHEVVGIAGHSKGVFIGVGGHDTINKTHFLGAVCGMERVMGRAQSPVRAVLDYMSEHLAHELPLSYVLTVRGRSTAGQLVTRGLFAGDDRECFHTGAQLCQRVNVDLLDEPLHKAVVYLDPQEYKSLWLGNKAIYRLRMALADGAELIILAPSVHAYGEDAEIDRLIRKYGYRGTPHTLRMVRENADLAGNLSAAAHLIHGSSEGRFTITLCPGQLTRAEVEGAGFGYAALPGMLAHYDPQRLVDGHNRLPTGASVFFVSNPATGLWAWRKRFEEQAAWRATS